MTRSLPAAITVALIFIAFVALPHSALAGGYDVYSCDATVAGAANHSWVAAADGGMTAYSDCPAGQGLVARNGYDGGQSTFLQGAWMIFDAPAGNSIDSVSFEVGLRRNDCNWTVALIGSNYDLGGNVLFGWPGGQYCDSPLQTPDDYSYLVGRYSFPVGNPRVRLESRCTVAVCSRSSIAAIHIRNVDVRVHDDIAPMLTDGRGSLRLSGAWLSGSQSIGFNASDSAGISDARIQIDGHETYRKTSACDPTAVAPCPQASIDQSFPTAGFGGDGAHTITLAADDAAGNPSSVSRTIYVDNTAPDPPKNLTVAGGDGWRSTNDFNITWGVTPPKVGAHVAGAEWDLCPTTGGACTHGSANGPDIASLSHLKLPAPGEYSLKLWLRDEAGNQDSRLAAPPAMLRYDDVSPSLAFEAPDPNDPTLLAVGTTDRGSGVGSGQIEMRRPGTGQWLALPTTVQGGRLTAHIDDVHLGDGVFEVQATATDLAGNQRTTNQRADGTTETVTLPLRLKTSLKTGVVIRHGHKARLARAASAHYGQLVRVRGHLTSTEGNPLQDVEVQAYTQIRDGVTPPRLIATVKTSRQGGFSFLVRKGPSRTIKITYGGTAEIRSATKTLTLNVRSQTSIRPNHHARVNGESVRLHGRIGTGRIPPHGKLVEVQVWVRGKWRTFATARAGRRGSWSYNYRFDGTRGKQTYRFRASVPPETGYPFATGRSRVVRVHVVGV